MKQEIKVVALALAMALVFLCGVVVGTTNGGIKIEMTGTGAVATGGNAGSSTGTQAPPQQSLGEQGGASAEPQDKVTTSSGLERPADTDYAGMCEAYNKAVNDYRAFKGTATVHKVEDTKVEITELPAAAKPLEGTINSVIGNIVKPVDETFTFTNGVDVNDPARFIDHKMIPGGRDAAVTPNDLAEAKIVENADGGYTITVKFLSETATYDGTTSTEPVHHMTAMDPLNLATLDISPLTIFSAEMTYPGATTSITVDGEGRLIKLTNSLPLEGKGQGGMGFIKATIGLAGKMEAVYDITYA